MPPPEPIGPYVTLTPYAASICGIHADTSGATNELPAPVRDPAETLAPAPVVRTSAAPIVARTASVLRVKIAPLVWFTSLGACPASFLAWEERWLRAGNKVVNGGLGGRKAQ